MCTRSAATLAQLSPVASVSPRRFRQHQAARAGHAQDTLYDCVVCGGGMSGTACTLELANVGLSVCWVDPRGFGGGALEHQFGNCPANTKGRIVRRWFGFDDMARTSDIALALEAASKEDNALSALLSIEDDEFPQLGVLGRAMRVIADEAVLKSPLVTAHQQGAVSVEEVASEDGPSTWKTTLADGTVAYSKNVVLCMGADPSPPIRSIDAAFKASSAKQPRILTLETSLDAARLAAELGPDDVVGVVGRSHSGVLIAKNAVAAGAKRTVIFHADPLLLAVDLPNGSYGRNYTGLKGAAKAWALEHLTVENSDTGTLAQAPSTELCEDGGIERHGCTVLVYATGFRARAKPEIHTLGNKPTTPSLSCVDSSTCEIMRPGGKSGEVVPGLYGLGVGMPCQVVDSYSNLLEVEVGIGPFRKRAVGIASVITGAGSKGASKAGLFASAFASSTLSGPKKAPADDTMVPAEDTQRVMLKAC